MMKDILYDTLKQYKRGYEIMLLRDQQGKTFTELAKKFERSGSTVRRLYDYTKIRQMRLYANHIAFVLGHEDDTVIKNIYLDAYRAYQNWACACAYLELKYGELLQAYRAGEPGMPAAFVEALPPCNPTLSDETLARLVALRDRHKATFPAIAKQLQLTPEKARFAYCSFYDKRVLSLVKKLAGKPGTTEDLVLWQHYRHQFKSPKKQYDALLRDYNLSEEE